MACQFDGHADGEGRGRDAKCDGGRAGLQWQMDSSRKACILRDVRLIRCSHGPRPDCLSNYFLHLQCLPDSCRVQADKSSAWQRQGGVWACTVVILMALEAGPRRVAYSPDAETIGQGFWCLSQ